MATWTVTGGGSTGHSASAPTVKVYSEIVDFSEFTTAASHTFGPSSTSGECDTLFGHMSAVATASHIAKTEVIRDPDSFADVVRGLHVFGRKVLRGSGTGYTAVYAGVVDLNT